MRVLAVNVAVAVGRGSSVGVFVGIAAVGVAVVAVADAMLDGVLVITVTLAVWKGSAVSGGG
jgi:hypothetical protein